MMIDRNGSVISNVGTNELTNTQVEDLCNTLKIESECVNVDMKDFRKSIAILLVLYFGSYQNDGKTLTLSLGELSYVRTVIADALAGNYNNISTLDMIKLYKARVIDLRDIIYQRSEGELFTLVNKLAKEHKLRLKRQDREECVSIAKEYFLSAIEKLQPISDKKMCDFLFGYTEQMLGMEMIKYQEISAHEVYPWCVGLEEEDLRLAASEGSHYEKFFSKEVENALMELSLVERNLIYLLFVKQFTYEEIAKRYNLGGVSAIEKRSNDLLAKLKSNKYLQKIVTRDYLKKIDKNQSMNTKNRRKCL